VSHLFLPGRVIPVRNLDATSLRAELARRRLLRSEADPRFRVRPTGRFDAALVPGGLSGQPCDRWWMFVEESLSPRDQYALYAHEVKVWDTLTGQELITLKAGGYYDGLAFSPDGHWLASDAGTAVTIWDATPLPAKP
jgi:hypothetical protein